MAPRFVPRCATWWQRSAARRRRGRDGVTIQLPGTDPAARALLPMDDRPPPISDGDRRLRPTNWRKWDRRTGNSRASYRRTNLASPGKRLFARLRNAAPLQLAAPVERHLLRLRHRLVRKPPRWLGRAVRRARKPGGIALGWLIVIGVVALIVVALLWR